MERKFIVLTKKANALCEIESFDYNPENLKDNEAIIETSMSLISAGTELSRVYEIKQGFSYPVYPGYTTIGKVLAKGKDVEGVEVGDRVFCTAHHASINIHKQSNKTQGSQLFKMDERLTDKQMCLVQMGMIAMNAINVTNGQITDTVAIYGLGTIGIITALLFKSAGLRVIAFDPIKSRCELAKDLGIEEVYDCAPDKQVEILKSITNGKGADINVDVSGISGAINNCVLGAAKHGQVILLGSPRAPFTCDVTPIFNAIHMKMLEVKGAFNECQAFYEVEGTRLNVLRNVKAVERLLLDGTIDADKLISHVIKPEQIMEAYHGLMFEKEIYHCVAIDWKGE